MRLAVAAAGIKRLALAIDDKAVFVALGVEQIGANVLVGPILIEITMAEIARQVFDRIRPHRVVADIVRQERDLGRDRCFQLRPFAVLRQGILLGHHQPEQREQRQQLTQITVSSGTKKPRKKFWFCPMSAKNINSLNGFEPYEA